MSEEDIVLLTMSNHINKSIHILSAPQDSVYFHFIPKNPKNLSRFLFRGVKMLFVVPDDDTLNVLLSID